MAKSPEVEHLEKAAEAARKVLDHQAVPSTEHDQTEAEIEQQSQEA
jgi:hypothetical protein